MKEKVAIFGGSFNPPHVGHLFAATLVLATQEADFVLVVPTYRHPFAKALAPFEDRITMCTLAMGWLPHVAISRIEEELGGESRTHRTLEHLQANHPNWSMRLVMGSDTFAESSKWYRFDLVQALAPPIVLTRAARDAQVLAPALLPRISSTDVRTHVANGEWEAIQELVPRSVISHIRARALYQSVQTECASTSSAPAK